MNTWAELELRSAGRVRHYFRQYWVGDWIEEAREFSKKTFEPCKEGKAAKEIFDEKNKLEEEELLQEAYLQTEID